jgi:tRNA (mo5U34)-methyltransferase
MDARPVDTSKSSDELLAQINSLPWFHSIDLGGGIVTPGRTSLEVLRTTADAVFEGTLEGKTVLDIGCYNGAYSFEAVRRGAKRVLATDHFVWQADPRIREAFDLARAFAAPDVEAMVADLDDLTPQSVGRFDVVLFLGVLYHLRHPLLALERIADLATETLVVETHMDATDADRPTMIFYPGVELNGDPSNWWGPNPACVKAMLHDVGFRQVDYQPNPMHSNRGLFHARR